VRQQSNESAFAVTNEVLARHWNLTATQLRPLQSDAIAAQVNRQDSLVVLPTGGGKSLCYQAPAMMDDAGPTLVISPLISLMKDQVDQCQQRGIPAAFLNSSQHAHQQESVERNAIEGKLRLLYVAPERIDSPAFLAFLAGLKPSTIVVDEAHCISQWGHDFRPSYAWLGQLRTLFPRASIHAYTATATEPTREEIVRLLGLRDPVILIGEFDRPNLFLRVERRTDIHSQIVGYVEERADQSGIIYCIRRAETELLADMLGEAKVPAAAYHAGLDAQTRTERQEAFMAGECHVVVATVAFGMGIDKSDIRYVMHAAMPQSMEHYHQQIGRAGRDGEPADCPLLWSPADFDLWEDLLYTEQELLESPWSAYQQDDPKLARLFSVDDYCREDRDICRHQQLVDYFAPGRGPQNCRNCDVCRGAVSQKL